MHDLRREFAREHASFIDQTGKHPRDNHYWAPVIVSREQLDAEVERLAALPKPPDGRRHSLIVHPSSRPGSPGFAPGIQVSLHVLLPGESTEPMRHNAAEVNFCIRGGGSTRIAGRTIAFRQYDVWNHPAFVAYSHSNDTNDTQVRLVYTNTPLLQHMEVYVPEFGVKIEEAPTETAASHASDDPARRNPFGMFPIGEDGGLLMPYETLINPWG
jgi:gentisate 1,2-dioxygenase